MSNKPEAGHREDPLVGLFMKREAARLAKYGTYTPAGENRRVSRRDSIIGVGVLALVGAAGLVYLSQNPTVQTPEVVICSSLYSTDETPASNPLADLTDCPPITTTTTLQS